MKTKSISLVCMLLALSSLRAEEAVPQEDCGRGFHPDRFTFRHIEANGIGYDEGYSTLEGFFSSNWDNWTPFLDLRAHLFNNGKPAFNTGIGARYECGWVWGTSLFYDYRKTRRTHFNQIGVGLEGLGEIWEVRANGYIPVGSKRSHFYSTAFSKFQGHHLVIERKQQVAMTGVDGEVGAHFCKACDIDFFAGIGPYYFAGSKGRDTVGGKFRLTGRWKEYITLEGTISYDGVFRDIYQGQLGVTIPFGGRDRIKKREDKSCSSLVAFNHRRRQPVVRDEIIVAERRKEKTVAISPITGHPYEFWFVDNTSHSAGTFESPFNTLVAAQNASSTDDVIYIFPGDGTSNGMNAGILLKQNQQLLGSGFDHPLATSVGTITIPSQASGIPILTNLSGAGTLAGKVIGLASNNTISGFQVIGALSPCIAQIFAAPIVGLNISKNMLVQNTNAGFPAVFTTTIGGNVLFTENAVTGDAGVDFEQINDALNIRCTITKNRFDITNGVAITTARSATSAPATSSTRGVFTIMQNSINALVPSAQIGVGFTGAGGTVAHMSDSYTVAQNEFIGAGSPAGYTYTARGAATQSTIVYDRNFASGCNVAYSTFALDTAQLQSKFTNNVASASGLAGAYLITSGNTAVQCTVFEGNAGLTPSDALTYQAGGSSTLNVGPQVGNAIPLVGIIGTVHLVTSCE